MIQTKNLIKISFFELAPPEIKCPPLVYAGFYEKNVKIICNVTSQTPIEHVSWFWHEVDENSNSTEVKLNPGDMDDHATTEIKEVYNIHQ